MPNVLMLDFLADLRENNSLDWMHAHKKRKKEAQNAFLELVQGCIADLAETEPCLAALDAKDLAFRINRDTRFSDDKSPYNPTFRAHISPAGRMPVPVGYFVSVTPGGSFAGGGPYRAAPSRYAQCPKRTPRNARDTDPAALRASSHGHRRAAFGRSDP